jgi:uncharacterized membrane protein
MNDVLCVIVGTVSTRPYVFAFLVAYLIAAILHIGWRKTLCFTIVGYIIAFVSEYSSIHNGFPYGWYYYIETTRQKELWIAGVPFFDSISYVFLAYCSYATAILVVAPVKAWRWNFVSLETKRIRKSLSVLFLASLFQVFLDIIIDPVALQGERWFLGRIYGYKETGVHFGIPLSNYIGWLLVSVLLILALQIIDAFVGRKKVRTPGMKSIPFRSLFGPALYISVIIFNLAITILIGERLMAFTGILTFTLPIAIVAVLLVRRTNRYSREELSEHLRDYPNSPVSGRKT